MIALWNAAQLLVEPQKFLWKRITEPTTVLGRLEITWFYVQKALEVSRYFGEQKHAEKYFIESRIHAFLQHDFLSTTAFLAHLNVPRPPRALSFLTLFEILERA